MSREFKIGVLVDNLKLGVADGVRKAKELGADGIQLYVTGGEMYPDNMDSARRAEFRKFVADLGLEISALCADFDWVKGFLDREHNETNIPRVKKCLDLAEELGVRVVTMHIGKLPEDENDAVYQEALRTTTELAQYAEARGRVLASETGPEAPDSLLEFLKRVPTKAVAVNYDPANLVMCGPFDQIGGVGILRDYIAHTHAKDGVCLGNGGFTELSLGQGGVVFPYYLAALKKVGYDGYITVEREAGDDRVGDVARAIEFLDRVMDAGLPDVPWD